MTDDESQGCLHDMFKRQAAFTPDLPAVVDPQNGSTTTFRELDRMTDVLASALRVCGVQPDGVVGIYMPKCLEYIISYTAILKAGGAYMPLDVSYPVQLLESILNDSKPTAILASEELVQNLQGCQNVIVLNKGWVQRLEVENGQHASLAANPPEVGLDNLAYVVYSSGTTGKPKGIMCPHRGAVLSYHWRHENYPFQPDERVACNVFIVWELFRPLLKGIPVYIIPDNVIYDPPLLLDFLHTNKITRILFTPSLLETVLHTENSNIAEKLCSLRIIWLCGEVVTTALRDRIVTTLPQIKLLNLYSISECHDVSVANLSAPDYDIVVAKGKPRKFCPVGRLLPGIHVVIMDDKLNPLPVGVPGEIFIGGPTLARGYINLPEENAKRFIKRPDSVPASLGETLYRVGDWGYILSNGSLEICGRCDSMVKIRGYSIETQAVEVAILNLQIVKAAVVLAEGEEGTDKQLIAYVVPEGQVSAKDIRTSLKKHLPYYMIPSYFILLSSIPVVAATGKLDKKALPKPNAIGNGEVGKESVPNTPTEQKLSLLWSDILQIKNIDVQEDFFDLGGHSLLAAKLLNKIKEEFGLELAIVDLFSHSSITSMASMIDNRLNLESRKASIIPEEPSLDLMSEVRKHNQTLVNILDIDMQLRAFWRSVQYGDRWRKGRVLLTGATGFLGAFLLRDLLTMTEVHIYCLVRELPDMTGGDRLKKTLQQFGLLPKNTNGASKDENPMLKLFEQRVEAIQGDVSLVNMGMGEEDYTYLSYEIDFIIHAAASVNLIYPYKALHSVNVVGTENLIIFACTNKIKPFHYISTNGVFPKDCERCLEDADITRHHSELSDGYGQSKWAAEQLVVQARSKGLPVAIYRPGNISGESREGYWNPRDSILFILQACARTMSAPDINWKVEMTPVDFVSSTIVKLTQNLLLAVGKTFHLTQPRPLDSSWLFSWMNANEYPLSMVPYESWCENIGKLRQSTSLTDQALADSLDGIIRDSTFFCDKRIFDNSNLNSVIGSFNDKYPELNSELLRTYFKCLSQRGELQFSSKFARLKATGPLTGRVAIVTGASSGIGQAVALELAQSGARVAVAARRQEKLDLLKLTIEQEGGVALPVKTDMCDRHQVKALIEQTESILGPVDILVNNAGCMYYTEMKNLHEDEWERMIDINCKGVVNGIGAVLQGMISRGKGHIVNLSSDAGRKAFAGLAVYSGTKFFVEGMSSALRQELVGSGVKVTCIQPGDVATELLTHNTDQESKEKYDGSSSCKILEPRDIAKAIVYAVTQPDYVGVNEILIEPREAPT